MNRPTQEIGFAIHGKIHEIEHENSGIESGHKTEELAVLQAGRGIRSAYRPHKLKPYRVAAKVVRKVVKANADFLYQKALRDNPQLAASNPVSRFW